MVGECYYQMGQHNLALQQYTAALAIFYAYSDWMIRVEFQAIRPSNPGEFKPAPWGRSTRPVLMGHYKDTMPIALGQVNNNAVVQQGGVVQMATLQQIHVQEIVRCTCLAMRRRAS